MTKNNSSPLWLGLCYNCLFFDSNFYFTLSPKNLNLRNNKKTEPVMEFPQRNMPWFLPDIYCTVASAPTKIKPLNKY